MPSAAAMTDNKIMIYMLIFLISAGFFSTEAWLATPKPSALPSIQRRCQLNMGRCGPQIPIMFNSITVLATVFSIMIPSLSTFPTIATADLGPLITEKEVIVYFKGNPEFLKNPVLEAIRKIDQIDPDTEFQNVNKVILLVPIIDIEKDIKSVSELITADKGNLEKANEILKSKKFDTAAFKKTFNRYSDNIYYSDPERANIYLGGGAVPNTQQTTQYLFRNSALTAIGDVKEDVQLLLDDMNKKKEVDSQAVADAVDDCREASEALTSYLELADPSDVKDARAIVYGGLKAQT